MKKLLFKLGLSLLALALMLIITFFTYLEFWHKSGVTRAEEEFHSFSPEKISELGSTEHLTIIPLVNWHKNRDYFVTELGVSYLIKTDQNTILFDLGQNKLNQSPSPLSHNMKQLNISLAEIDTIFLSHNHFDHVGGHKWSKSGSFSIDSSQSSLSGKKVFTPVPMTYPNLELTYTPSPKKLLKGVATTGTIPRQLFMGWIDEQALAINVRGKGIILIVGCGHQTLHKLIARAEAIFEQPIYGVVGDLHYPVPDGRLSVLGVNGQRIFASGTGPLSFITRSDIEREVQLLLSLDLGIVALGGHDSSDEIIEYFKNSFGDSYESVAVGKPIDINEKEGRE